MTYTWTIGRNQITINTTTGTITGSTYPLRDLIKENFPAIEWDKASKCWAMDGEQMQQIINEYTEYFTRVYKMDTISSPAKTSATIEDKKVVSTELINGKDGFYQIAHYSDGTQSKHFLG